MKRISASKITSLFVSAITLSVASTAVAQTPPPPPVELEGRILSVNTASRSINVMGMNVAILARTVIKSPTGTIRFEDLVGNTLPGRTQPGFIGGTASVDGIYLNNRISALTIEVTPDENVSVGYVRWVEGKLTNMRKPFTLLQDPRMPGRAINAGGLPVDLSTAPEDAVIGLEGYNGEDGMFYAFLVECDAAQIPAGTVATAITRARARDDDEIEVSGGTTALTGTVRIFNADTGARLGDATITSNGNYGTYFARISNLATLPARVRVVNVQNSSAATAEVD